MATLLKEALNADAMQLAMYCGGQSYVGINLAGTWVGTVKFYGSFDGVNFRQIYVTPFASGTDVQSATANGTWFVKVQNYLVIKVIFTRTSGTVNVTLSTSSDSSYQDAYLTPATIHQYQSVASGATNVITVAASTNRAWKVSKITTAFDVAAAATVLLTVESPALTILHAEYVALAAGTYESKIPSVGVTGGLGDALVVRLAAPGGSVVSKVNALVGAA